LTTLIEDDATCVAGKAIEVLLGAANGSTVLSSFINNQAIKKQITAVNENTTVHTFN
jgi:hypothetical protein